MQVAVGVGVTVGDQVRVAVEDAVGVAVGTDVRVGVEVGLGVEDVVGVAVGLSVGGTAGPH